MAEIVFDERIAASYDADSAAMYDPAIVDPAVDFLVGLAGDGAALELGVGTGRIALPLSRRGIRVRGIDVSQAMVDRLREKPGAAAVDVTIGDFATTAVDGPFALVYVVYNTITNLTTQDEQVACFRSVSAHLEPGGCFVVEVVVPELRRLPPGDTVRVFTSTPTRLGFDEYDLTTQTLVSHDHWITDRGRDVFSSRHRYVWPSELDLMARLAGMTLRERWADWHRAPFTGESTSHVSVWGKD